MKKIDMLGKSCPLPVVEAKKALASQDTDGVLVLVDNAAAVQNLKKMADGMGCAFSYEQESEKRYEVRISAGGQPLSAPEKRDAPQTSGTVILVTADHMGRGSEELGRMLMKSHIFSLCELNVPPCSMYFINSGVNLTSEGSGALGDLLLLASKGVEIKSCGTCLNYYGLTERLAVGEITDMLGITDALMGAERVITL